MSVDCVCVSVLVEGSSPFRTAEKQNITQNKPVFHMEDGFFLSSPSLLCSPKKTQPHEQKFLNQSSMRSTCNCSFYCRASRANKQGFSPVELSIIVNGKRLFINLPYKARPEEFNRKRRPAEIEEYINTQRALINTVILELAQNGIPVTAETLRDYYRTGGVKSYTAADLFDDYLKIQKRRVPSTLSKGVYRKYELVRDLFFSTFEKEKEVTAITNAVVRNFFAVIDDRYDNSTACGYKTKFKSFITFGIDNGKIKINPMQGIKITKERKEIEYLTNSEILRIIQTPIENKSLSDVRDAFVLQLSTGLAYADIAALKKEDIQITSDGTHYIVKQRVKTGTTYTTVILPEGVEVLKKHGYQLRVITNQKYNAMLKVIQTLCGIQKNLTTHVARHSFAQRLLSSGVRIETVSKALGHVDTKVTQRFYCQVRTPDVINEINSIMK